MQLHCLSAGFNVLNENFVGRAPRLDNFTYRDPHRALSALYGGFGCALLFVEGFSHAKCARKSVTGLRQSLFGFLHTRPGGR